MPRRKKGNVITLTGLGGIGAMSKNAKIGVGLLVLVGAGVGAYFLFRDAKKGQGVSGMGYIGNQGVPEPANQLLLGDHNSQVMAQYYQRQQEIGVMRAMGL